MKLRTRLASSQSKRFLIHKKTRAYAFWLLILVLIFIFIFCLSKSTEIKAFKINNIIVDGTSSWLNEKIKIEAENILSGKYVGLFARRNIFIYPHDELLATLGSLSSKIKYIEIKKSGFQTLKVRVKEREPVAIVCAKLPDILELEQSESNMKDCYYVDFSGLIFDFVSTDLSEPLNLYFIPDILESASTTDNIINSSVNSVINFIELQDFYKETMNTGLNPHYILVKSDGEFEMYADNTIIYFNNKSSLQKQLSNLISFWDYMLKKNHDYKIDFEYIDIRYGSNVFYR